MTEQVVGGGSMNTDGADALALNFMQNDFFSSDSSQTKSDVFVACCASQSKIEVREITLKA